MTVLLPPSVRFDQGAGGLPRLTLNGVAGTAEVYLHGAHVTAWVPTGEEPALWLSPTSQFAPEAAIRGGIPLCFPWFGALAADPSAPAHGFARLRDWELVSALSSGDAVSVTLRLSDDETTRGTPWPHAFEADYTVTVGRDLTLSLTVTNRDDVPITFEEALHTYLHVWDVRQTEVHGLEDTPYLDRSAGPSQQSPEHSTLRFTAQTDRIYLPTERAVSVRAPGRTITISKNNSRATVVWNPWVDGAAALTDMPDDAWTGMLCVETCNVRDTAVTLLPSESHTMSAVVSTSS